MNIETGERYESLEKALAAGVPRSDIAHVEGFDTDAPIVTFASGPFKGRQYRRDRRGCLVRMDK